MSCGASIGPGLCAAFYQGKAISENLEQEKAIMAKIEENLKQYFRPEFLNRIDEIIVFNSLTENELLEIIDLLLNETKQALENKDINLNISLEAKKYILSKGTDLKYGARPLRRAIQRYIEDEIAEKLLRGEFISGQTINIDLKEDKLIFE